MAFLKSFWKMLGRILKTIWDALRPILALVCICIAIWAALTVGWLVALCWLGAAFLIDADFTADVVKTVGNSLATAASAVASVTAGVAGSVAKGFLSSPLGLAVLGVGAFVLLRRKDDSEGRVSA